MSFADFDAEAIRDYETVDDEMLVHAISLAGDIKGELAGEVEGSLRAYLLELRAQAAQSLAELGDIDPHDPVAIIEAQSFVRSYRHLENWIKSKIDRADDAREIIREQSRHHSEFEGDTEGY